MVCPVCGTYNRISEFNEWALMSRLSRCVLFLRYAWTALLYAVLPMLIFYYTLRFMFSETFERMPDNQMGRLFLVLYVLSVLIMGYICTVALRRDIRISNHRMSDPAYRALLTRLGLLK